MKGLPLSSNCFADQIPGKQQCQKPYISKVPLISKTLLLGVPELLTLNAKMDISPPLHSRIISIPGGNPVLCSWKQGSTKQCFIPTAGVHLGTLLS